MIRSLGLSLLLLLAVLPSTAQRHTSFPSAPVASRANQVVGYFPQWGVYNRRYLPVDLVSSGAIKSLTQINYAQANVRDNVCVVADPQADLNLAFKAENSIDGNADAPDALLRGNFHQFQLLRKRYPKLRVLISIMGKRSVFEDVAKPEHRAAFVHSCIARFLQGHIAPGVEAPHLFDGIDVDWEYPDDDHAKDFHALMAEFRKQMDAYRPGFTLSIATGASQKNIDPVDWKLVARSVDQIGVMTYDFGGPWSRTTGLVAPLRSQNAHEETVESVIESYLAAGVPARQLLLGLPFYAYEWRGVPENATHGLGQKGDPMHGNLNQATATALAAGPNARLYRDPASQSPWIYDGDNFLTFEDPISIHEKAAFAREQKLGGVMIWELSGDTKDTQLLRALRASTAVTRQVAEKPRGASVEERP